MHRLRETFPDLYFDALDANAPSLGLGRAQAILLGWDSPAIDDLLDHAPDVRWIHSIGTGVEEWLSPRLRDSGVVLTNCRGTRAVAIAEHVLAMMLAFARQLPLLLDAQRAARWAAAPLGVFELQGQTLVIVGLGAIGSALASKAAALGVCVIGVRRRPAAAPPGVTRVVGLDELDTVLDAADHVAITLPLTDETHGLFGAARLARLRPTARLYNVGRGPVVDTQALLRALEEGRLAGAGLDVTDPEPLSEDSRLWRHPQVLVTAHTSGTTPFGSARALDVLIDNIGRVRRGEPLINRVDMTSGY
ncbi:D-2-hydroxyacid dehydrogenase [Pseudomonas typographi]|uniref:D-2-hydroxyacid dehydrogenase n=1 Tax=Pseudomonas typographi TaxID=2715964 RepID=A0ABR7Z335_9PSED|nr:D-2-hydroxyacid dehydrogenase [Pseudomonas typographi]MBD1599754.1 D-2-hydroxyacid dehydrogenase [Pseudomonas typographi]